LVMRCSVKLCHTDARSSALIGHHFRSQLVAPCGITADRHAFASEHRISGSAIA
jgi:hypothetical protein